MKVLVIDNYDSFLYNLVRYIGELGAKPLVYRNDELTLEKALKLKPERIVIFIKFLWLKKGKTSIFRQTKPDEEIKIMLITSNLSFNSAFYDYFSVW